jgi:hypothetical protein
LLGREILEGALQDPVVLVDIDPAPVVEHFLGRAGGREQCVKR